MKITTLFDGFAIIEDPEYNRITIKETVLANDKVRDFRAQREFDKKVFKMRDRFLIGSEVIKFNDTYDAMLDEPTYIYRLYSMRVTRFISLKAETT